MVTIVSLFAVSTTYIMASLLQAAMCPSLLAYVLAGVGHGKAAGFDRAHHMPETSSVLQTSSIGQSLFYEGCTGKERRCICEMLLYSHKTCKVEYLQSQPTQAVWYTDS